MTTLDRMGRSRGALLPASAKPRFCAREPHGRDEQAGQADEGTEDPEGRVIGAGSIVDASDGEDRRHRERVHAQERE